MLPQYYMITDERNYQRERFLKQLIDALTLHKTLLVQLRVKQIPFNEYIVIAKQAIRITKDFGSTIILNSQPELAVELGADGIHLPENELMTTCIRPLPANKLVSAACHNEQQLIQANKIHADLATLSPVLSTTTHPEAIPLGWQRFLSIATIANMPVYALGGLTTMHLPIAIKNGAYGIAGIRAFCNAHTS